MNKRGHSAFSALSKKQHVPNTERGFILVAVIVAITLVAAIAFALSQQGTSEANITSGELERDQLRYVVEAGMAHAKLQLAKNTSCGGYTDIPKIDFGAGSYRARFDPDAGSPVTIKVTGYLESGPDFDLSSDAVRAYQPSTTVILQLGKTAGKDTMINRWFDIQNYGALDNLTVRSDPSRTQRALLEFDLSAIPASAEIISATLELQQRAISTAGVINVHRVTRSWLEGTGTGTGGADGATWLSHDGSTSWSQPGGDFDSTQYAATPTTISKNGQWVAWDIRDLVDEWVSGQLPNYGLLLAGDGVVDSAEFHSSEGLDPASAPKLTIVFACECGVGGSSSTLLLLPGSEGKEAMLRGTKNYGAAPYTWIDTSVPYHSLYEFDLSGLASNAMVTSALLDIHQSSADVVATAADLDVHRVTTTWVEGTGDNSGLTPADGVTWFTSDGSTAWNSAGGDYDGTVIDSSIVNSTTDAWHQWNVTSLVQSWVDGTHSNFGFLLRASSGSLEKLYLDTGEANDPAVHPKLTINYSCPCGATCLVLNGGGTGKNVLLVVGNAGSPSGGDLDRKALIESWGHAVTLIDDGDSQANFNTAMAANDVVYNAGSSSSANVGTKLTAATIGVLSEDMGLVDELGIAEPLFVKKNSQHINVIDNTHYVTSGFGLGTLQLYSYLPEIWTLSGALAPGLQMLGETQDGVSTFPPGLAVLESGSELYGGGYAAGRRVQVPWAQGSFDINALNANGKTIMQRAIEWGTGAGPPPPPPGYLDQFNDSTCDAAIDYAGTDGAVDWSPWAWTEINELDGPCSGQIRVATDPDIDDAGSSRLRVVSQGVRVYRTVDLTGFSQPTLSFDYRLTDYPSLDFMRIRVFDGVDYTEIGRFTGPLDQTEYQSASYSLSAFAGLEIQVQFEFNGVSTTRTSYIDNVHVQEAGGSGPTTCIFRDDFENQSYGNQDGNALWAGDWQEVNDDGSPTGGDIRTEGGGSPGDSLRIQDDDRPITRAADLSGHTTATLTLDYKRVSLENGEYVAVSVYNGSTWTELAQFGNPPVGNDSNYQPYSEDISGYISPNFQIRLASPGGGMGNSDDVKFDNLQIEATGGATCP